MDGRSKPGLEVALASVDDRLRRVSPVVVRPDEGRLTERPAGAQPVRRVQVFMPLSGRSCQTTPGADALKRPSRSGWELAQLGWRGDLALSQIRLLAPSRRRSN